MRRWSGWICALRPVGGKRNIQRDFRSLCCREAPLTLFLRAAAIAAVSFVLATTHAGAAPFRPGPAVFDEIPVGGWG